MVYDLIGMSMLVLSFKYMLFIFQSTSKAEPVWFEIKGPRGSMFLIQALTENPKLVKQNLNSVNRKSG